MRESVITKSSFKAVLAFIIIAALCVAAFSPLFAAKTAVAEAWPDTYAVTYAYNMGFTPVAGSYKVVYDGKTYDSKIPASLGAVESKEAGMRFSGFEIDGGRGAAFEDRTLTVASGGVLGAAGGTGYGLYFSRWKAAHFRARNLVLFAKNAHILRTDVLYC